MKYLLVFALLLLTGCPDPADAPVTVYRATGIEAVSSMTVVIVSVPHDEDLTPGTRTQRALVAWLKANPEAKILHMDVVGNNGWPQEVLLIVEGELGP